MARTRFMIVCLVAVVLTISVCPSVAQPPAAGGRVLIGFRSVPGLEVAAARSAAVEKLGGRVRYAYGFVPVVAASVPEAGAAQLRADPRVAYVEPDYEVHATAQTLPWGIDRIDADVVHAAVSSPGSGIGVAIIDTGIQYNHPDLAANYGGGYDFANDDADPMDDNGHGTHCAGIVAACNNSVGVVGVAPAATLYALKVLGSNGSGSTSDIIAAIEWARTWSAEHPAEPITIISMSLGSDSYSESFETACNQAYASGLLLVAAAGNDYQRMGKSEQNTVDYPGQYASVIAVAATDQSNLKASFSSTGPAVELAAPGVSIPSTYFNSGYASASGTSMACPHVAGTAALVKALNPSFTPDDIRTALRSTATDLGSVGRDTWYGYGLINAARATGVTPVVPGTSVHVGDLDGTSKILKSKWQATVKILVLNATGGGASGARVSGSWSTGVVGTGTTGADGWCSISLGNIAGRTNSVSFAVAEVTGTGLTYDAAANGDPDDDSDGTTITITK